jgi:hypothetical protein
LVADLWSRAAVAQRCLKTIQLRATIWLRPHRRIERLRERHAITLG